MRRILKVGYLSFHSPGVSWHSPQMFSEAFMNLHGERYLRDGWNFWSQIFAFPKIHTISITLSWVQCISPALDFGLGYVTLLWLMAWGQKWQCISSQPRPQRALYIFIYFHVPIPSPQEHDLNSSLNGPRRKKDIEQNRTAEMKFMKLMKFTMYVTRVQKHKTDPKWQCYHNPESQWFTVTEVFSPRQGHCGWGIVTGWLSSRW